MTRKFLITFDLKTAGRNYDSFFTALRNIGPWWHYLSSTWIVKGSNLNAVQIYDALAPHLGSNDHILVVEIDTRTKWGYLPMDAWRWLDS